MSTPDWSYQAALGRFAPLIAALADPTLRLPRVTFGVENTGGNVYCMFVRPADPIAAPRRARVIAFSDDWDEPDPTAESWAWLCAYSDWSTDEGTCYWSRIRYEHGNETAIASWAAPIIRGWLS